jgi:hypothetical protein
MAGATMRRAAALLLFAAGLGSVLHGCIIEERAFDERLARCTEYCDLIDSRCTAENAVYPNTEACMAVCALMEPGALGDASGNTLECRMAQLNASDFEVPMRCPAAGPGGNGSCGANCESFCKLRQQVCDGVQPAAPDIADPMFCNDACQGLADTKGSGVSAQATDTLQCRLIEVSLAAVSPSAAASTCRESQLVPENDRVCNDPPEMPIEEDCATYCGIVMASCTDEFAVYADEAQCQKVCRTFEQGIPGDTAQNTLRCRRYHAYAAFDRPEVHCTHAGPTGDGHCASPAAEGPGNCVSYCRILKQACPTTFQTRHEPNADDPADLGRCVASCGGNREDDVEALFSDSVMDGFIQQPRYAMTSNLAGPTLRCSTLHAVAALGKVDDPIECAAAFADGRPCL